MKEAHGDSVLLFCEWEMGCAVANLNPSQRLLLSSKSLDMEYDFDTQDELI